MPNWCTTRYIAVGSIDDITAFAKMINTMEDAGSDFGKYWLGNFLPALGLCEPNIDSILSLNKRIRGTFDPNFYAEPTFCGVEPDESQMFTPNNLDDKNAELLFSVTTAWGRSNDIENLIMKSFPSIELSWCSTDEFGNFHYSHNPNNDKRIDWVSLNGNTYNRLRGEMAELSYQLKSLLGEDIFEDAELTEEYIKSQEFQERVDLCEEVCLDFYEEV